MNVSPSYRDVYAFSQLLAAFGRARRAKRGRGGEPAFYRDLDHALLNLSDDLCERRYAPDPYHYFPVRHRKDRIVAEASFRDRVVHHALVGAVTPAFEARFISHSDACRIGHGVHRSVARTRYLVKRYAYFLKLDVEKYFETVPHAVVLQQVGEVIQDPGIMWLTATILRSARRSSSGEGGWRGLPIGNLTSQCWGNIVLNAVDQAVVAAGLSNVYQRYMDDMLVFGQAKSDLWLVAELIRDVAEGDLGLKLKRRVTTVAPVKYGVPWLGLRIFPAITRLDRTGRTRMASKLALSTLRTAVDPTRQGDESPRVAGVVGHATLADTMALRRSILARLARGW